MENPDRRPWVGPVLSPFLVALGLAATAASFNNPFVQDELPLVLRNETVHTLAAPARFFTQSYWRDPFPPALYRPLATVGHAVQWAVGGGSPETFRVVSAVLLIGAGLALYRLAGQLLPPLGAWAAAALFMVHPVHVEATALAVNQGELAVALVYCLAAATYVRARRRGPITAGATGVIALGYLVVGLFKENGLVLPLMLLAAELTVVSDPRSLRARLRESRRVYLVLALVAAVLLAARTAVLASEAISTPPAEALAGSGPGGRALTMLGVVAHWARLLLWPAQLQADYGPNEITAANGWQGAQWVGAAILAAWAAAFLWARRRLPGLAFGLLWIAVAVLPVSNVLVPTGIVLAERTLFLASAGAALGVAAVLSSLAPGPEHPVLRRGVFSALAALLGLGLLRSISRDQVWASQETLLRHTVVDAPRSYGAHLALARFLDDSGHVAAAEPHFREAAGLNPSLPERERRTGDQYRLDGLCRPALRHYRLPLLVRPGDHTLRASAVACLLHLGRYDEARVVAAPGLADPGANAYFRRAMQVADSALAAPPAER